MEFDDFQWGHHNSGCWVFPCGVPSGGRSQLSEGRQLSPRVRLVDQLKLREQSGLKQGENYISRLAFFRLAEVILTKKSPGPQEI